MRAGSRTSRLGFYHAHLKLYYELFGRERIEAFLFEDLSKDAVGVSQNIFRFLGVDEAFEPDTSLRHNVSGIPRSRALLGLVKTPNAVESFLKPLLPEGTRKRLSVNVQDWNLKKAAPLPEEARRGFAQTCRWDILALQDLIGRDLSGWLGEPRRNGKQPMRRPVERAAPNLPGRTREASHERPLHADLGDDEAGRVKRDQAGASRWSTGVMDGE